MKRKSWIAILVAAAMIVLLAAGCSSEGGNNNSGGAQTSSPPPASKETSSGTEAKTDDTIYDVSLLLPNIYFADKKATAETSGLIVWVRDNFGINFTVTGPAENLAQEVQLLRVQNKLPDMYMLPSLLTLSELESNGLVKDLSKYFNDPENYPNLAKIPKVYLSLGSINGKIYTIPGNYSMDPNTFEGEFNRWFMVEKEIRGKLGLGIPETVDAMMAYLEAVKSSQLQSYTGNKVYGIGGNVNWLVPMFDQVFGIDGFASFINNTSVGAILDKNGKFVPAWATEERYQTMKLINEMWRKGYFDPEAFSQDNTLLNTKLTNGQYALMIGSYGQADAFMSQGNKSESPDAAWAWYETHGPEVLGKISATGYDSLGLSSFSPFPGSFAVVNAKLPDGAVDKVMKWLDWKITEEGMFSDYYEGWFEETWKYDDAGKAIPYYSWWPNKDPKTDYYLDSTAEITKQPDGIYWTVHNPFSTILGPKFQKLVFDKGTYRKINIWYDFVYGTSKFLNTKPEFTQLQTPTNLLSLNSEAAEIYAQMSTIYERWWGIVATSGSESQFEDNYNNMLRELLTTDVQKLSKLVSDGWQQIVQASPDFGNMPFVKGGAAIPEVADIVS